LRKLDETEPNRTFHDMAVRRLFTYPSSSRQPAAVTQVTAARLGDEAL